MAVAQLRGNSGSNEEPLVREILSLGEKSLSGADHLKLQSTLTDNSKNIQFVLSNKDAYEEVALLKIDANKSIFFSTKVRSLCDKIEDYMRSPLQIDAEKTLLKKLSIGDKKFPNHMASRHYSGALAVLGGGAFAYMAGPGLLIIGERLKLEPF